MLTVTIKYSRSQRLTKVCLHLVLNFTRHCLRLHFIVGTLALIKLNMIKISDLSSAFLGLTCLVFITACTNDMIRQEVAIDRIDTSGVYITYQVKSKEFKKKFELDVSPENFYDTDSMAILIETQNPENVKFESIIHRKWPVEEAIIKIDNQPQLPVPFDISTIDNIENLYYTSGGSPANGELCDSTTNGFYGNYYLIDELNKKERAGIITIFREGVDMSTWTPFDSTQKFRQINLKTNILTIWEKIQVGMTEEELLLFIDKRFNYKKGTMIYVDFGIYEGDFRILGDTLNELKIKVKCVKK